MKGGSADKQARGLKPRCFTREKSNRTAGLGGTNIDLSLKGSGRL